MAENPAGSPRRLVVLSPLAISDQSAIYIYTAEQWGEGHAETYLDFLEKVMQLLADHPKIAAVVPERKDTRVYIARYKKARRRIFFRETNQGIYVLRILHTSMNWQDHLGDE